MMRKMLLAVSALVMASPAFAGTPDELGCIAKSYTAEAREELDALLPRVDFLKGSDDSEVMETFGGLVFGSVSTCATKYEWSEAELEPALLNEFGRLIEVGFRRHGPFTAAQIAKIDKTLAKGERPELWRALEEQLRIGYANQDITVSDENATVFGDFIAEIGLGLDEKVAEQIGVYLAAKAMQRTSARDFAAY